jgi:hypothetical protein
MSINDTREISLPVAKADGDENPITATVCFCESCASLTVGKTTIHISWSELAIWQQWLAQRVEQEI